MVSMHVCIIGQPAQLPYLAMCFIFAGCGESLFHPSAGCLRLDKAEQDGGLGWAGRV